MSHRLFRDVFCGLGGRGGGTTRSSAHWAQSCPSHLMCCVLCPSCVRVPCCPCGCQSRQHPLFAQTASGPHHFWSTPLLGPRLTALLPSGTSPLSHSFGPATHPLAPLAGQFGPATSLASDPSVAMVEKSNWGQSRIKTGPKFSRIGTKVGRTRPDPLGACAGHVCPATHVWFGWSLLCTECHAQFALFLELVAGNRCALVVVAVETGGRWSSEAVDLVSSLAGARARDAPPLLRRSTFLAWRRRWSRMLAVSCGRAFASSLVTSCSVTPDGQDGPPPELADLLA